MTVGRAPSRRGLPRLSVRVRRAGSSPRPRYRPPTRSPSSRTSPTSDPDIPSRAANVPGLQAHPARARVKLTRLANSPALSSHRPCCGTLRSPSTASWRERVSPPATPSSSCTVRTVGRGSPTYNDTGCSQCPRGRPGGPCRRRPLPHARGGSRRGPRRARLSAGAGRSVLVCEFFHALPMVTGNLIDTVRHGHFSYLTLLSAVGEPEPARARRHVGPPRLRSTAAHSSSPREPRRPRRPVDPPLANLARP